jgi:hypothetical protein
MLQGARDSLEDSTQAVWATLGLHEFVSENDNVAYETSIVTLEANSRTQAWARALESLVLKNIPFKYLPIYMLVHKAASQSLGIVTACFPRIIRDPPQNLAGG